MPDVENLRHWLRVPERGDRGQLYPRIASASALEPALLALLAMGRGVVRRSRREEMQPKPERPYAEVAIEKARHRRLLHRPLGN